MSDEPRDFSDFVDRDGNRDVIHNCPWCGEETCEHEECRSQPD